MNQQNSLFLKGISTQLGRRSLQHRYIIIYRIFLFLFGSIANGQWSQHSRSLQPSPHVISGPCLTAEGGSCFQLPHMPNDNNNTYYSQIWSGYIGTTGSYNTVSAEWTLPYYKDRNPNLFKQSAASYWVGLGGFLNGPLVQTVLQDLPDGKGGFIHYLIAEDFIPNNTHLVDTQHCKIINNRDQDCQVLLTLKKGLHPGDDLIFDVYSFPGQGDRYLNLYSVYNRMTNERAVFSTHRWPTSDGSTAEWIAERLSFDGGVTYQPLASFNDISFYHATAVRYFGPNTKYETTRDASTVKMTSDGSAEGKELATGGYVYGFPCFTWEAYQ